MTITTDGATDRFVASGEMPDWLCDRLSSEDPDIAEYAVPVRWTVQRPVEEAVWEKGLFAKSATVCKLRDERTLDTVQRAFGITPGDGAPAPPS